MKYKIAIIPVLLMLAACSAEDTGVAVTEAAPAKTLTNHPHSKPGAQVSLVEHQQYLIEPGEYSPLTIRLRSAQAQGHMRVVISGSDGLNILSNPTGHAFSLAPGVIYELPLEVHVALPGRYYLHLNIVTEGSGRQLARVVSVIVQAGKDQSLNTLRKLDADVGLGEENGPLDEPLIMLPAHETVVQ